jgi:amidase
MPYRTATELLAALRARKVSSVELAGTAIARIKSLDGKLNVVVVRDFDRAMKAARAADAAHDRGEDGPLLGLPVTVKEGFNIGGLPTTWGLPGTLDIPVTEDAVLVTRLKAAGAIVLGKTNVPVMLMDWQTGKPSPLISKRNSEVLSRLHPGEKGISPAALWPSRPARRRKRGRS